MTDLEQELIDLMCDEYSLDDDLAQDLAWDIMAIIRTRLGDQ